MTARRRRTSGLGSRLEPTAPRPVLVTALGLTWILALVVYQLGYGSRLSVVPWLALGALVASTVVPATWTSIVAVAGVAAVVGLSVHVGDASSSAGIIRICGSTALGVFAVGNAVVRASREQRIRRVTEIATVAQATILHPVPARVGPLRLRSRYVSATADALVGGDLYDVIDTPYGVRIIVGDVRGKGLPAVRTASAVLSSFRAVAPRDVPLEEVAMQIERSLLQTGVLSDEDFVTAVLCQIQPDGTMTIVSCGHQPPLLLLPGGRGETLACSDNPPLGVGTVPTPTQHLLPAEARLLLYTDGLVEARNAQREFFPLESVQATLADHALTLDEALDALLDRLRQHGGAELQDDLAVLLVERLPIAQSGPERAASGS